jgi:hypothetical protein
MFLRGEDPLHPASPPRSERHRSTHARLTVLLAVACSAAVLAPSAAFAQAEAPTAPDAVAPSDAIVAPSDPLPPGVELTPSEEKTADVVIVPDPGTTVTADVVPGDCQDPAICGYTVTATNPPSEDPGATVARRGGRRSTSLHGAKIRHLRVHAVRKSWPMRNLVAQAAAYYASWTIRDDHLCGGYGCWSWEIQLNSHAWCNRSIAWGDTRNGYGGWASKDGTHGNGYSVNTSHLGFSGNGTYRDNFARHDADISALVKGFPISYSHYVHRHYPGSCGNAWLVAN